MAASRSRVFRAFRDRYERARDDRDMDAICSAPDDAEEGFRLQVQQEFLRDYVAERPWDKLLLYHRLGSGKTQSAITVAETWMDAHPQYTCLVILPARLLTNFEDELMGPGGMGRYMSAADFARFRDAATSRDVKRTLKRNFDVAVSARYTFVSFEKWLQGAINAASLSAWLAATTTDRIVVVDEVHNLLTGSYPLAAVDRIAELDRMIPAPGEAGLLFQYMTRNAHPTMKLLGLSATPVFDNNRQFVELVRAFGPSGAPIPQRRSLSSLVGLLRGRVSYFPGTSPNAYPTVSHETHDFQLTDAQYDAVVQSRSAGNDDDGDDEEEFFENGGNESGPFRIKERMLGIAAVTRGRAIDEVVEDLNAYAPKIGELVRLCSDLPGKHMVYSTFIKQGLDVARAALLRDGWTSMDALIRAGTRPDDWPPHRVFASWQGDVKNADKQTLKNVVNHVNNLDGRYVKVVLGSPAIREGVSFKHVQHVHLLDPVWNSSTKDQVEGRAIRHCSHVDIPADHPTLRRHVVVHVYKTLLGDLGAGAYGRESTADERIYDVIIPGKRAGVAAAEAALRKVAIDHYLFRRLYRDDVPPDHEPPARGSRDDPSNVSLDENADIPARKRIKKKQRCPSKRQPRDGQCMPGYELRLNRAGELCCYKLKAERRQRPALAPAPIYDLRSSSSESGAKAAAAPKRRLPLRPPRRPTDAGRASTSSSTGSRPGPSKRARTTVVSSSSSRSRRAPPPPRTDEGGVIPLRTSSSSSSRRRRPANEGCQLRPLTSSDSSSSYESTGSRRGPLVFICPPIPPRRPRTSK